MAFFTGKTGIPVPVDFVPVPDPTRKTSTRSRPIPAGTGRPAHLLFCSSVHTHMKSVVKLVFFHEFAFDDKALKPFVDFRIW